jgi:hypothetical protein
LGLLCLPGVEWPLRGSLCSKPVYGGIGALRQEKNGAAHNKLFPPVGGKRKINEFCVYQMNHNLLRCCSNIQIEQAAGTRRIRASK